MYFIKILKGILCGIIFISSIFWTAVLTFKYSYAAIVIAFLSAVLTNVIVGLLLASESHRQVLYKWLISLPVGIVTFLIYRQTNFLYYWINKVYPEYGNLSAGAGFALLLYMAFYIFSFFIAMAIAFSITSQQVKKLSKCNNS